jgi:hypothetical protein
MRIEEGSGPIDKLLTKKTKKVFTPLRLFKMAFIMIILNAILHVVPDFSMKSILSYFFGALILGSIIATMVTLKKAGSSYKQLTASLTNEPTDSEEKVTLYETTDEGIYINYFNQTKREQMLFIHWDNVQEMTLGEMKYMYTHSDNDSMRAERFQGNIRKKFKQAEKQLGYFPYEPKLTYSDVQAVFLKMGNHRYSELPIPQSWHKNGNYEQFMGVLRRCLEI